MRQPQYRTPIMIVGWHLRLYIMHEQWRESVISQRPETTYQWEVITGQMEVTAS